MKTWIKETAQKYIVGILISLSVMFGGSVVGMIKVFFSIPEEMKTLKELHKKDSTIAVRYMQATEERFTIIEARSNIHEEQISNNQKSTERIKNKFKIK